MPILLDETVIYVFTPQIHLPSNNVWTGDEIRFIYISHVWYKPKYCNDQYNGAHLQRFHKVILRLGFICRLDNCMYFPCKFGSWSADPTLMSDSFVCVRTDSDLRHLRQVFSSQHSFHSPNPIVGIILWCRLTLNSILWAYPRIQLFLAKVYNR